MAYLMLVFKGCLINKAIYQCVGRTQGNQKGIMTCSEASKRWVFLLRGVRRTRGGSSSQKGTLQRGLPERSSDLWLKTKAQPRQATFHFLPTCRSPVNLSSWNPPEARGRRIPPMQGIMDPPIQCRIGWRRWQGSLKNGEQ